jgi:hypothetical protein
VEPAGVAQRRHKQSQSGVGEDQGRKNNRRTGGGIGVYGGEDRAVIVFYQSRMRMDRLDHRKYRDEQNASKGRYLTEPLSVELDRRFHGEQNTRN